MGSGYRVFTAGEVLTASNVQNYLQDQAVMVFAGTAARSSAIGTANFEEGMLTYLTDVDKLQVYDGSSFEDVYPPAATSQGLTLINTTSFSGVASQSINNVFNSTYSSYQIIFRGTQSIASGFTLRVRAGGSDLSTTSYRWSYHFNISSNSAYNGGALGSDTAIDLVGGQVDAGFYVIQVNNPFALAKTSFHHRAHFLNGTNSYNVSGHGLVNDSVSYDGFTLISASGTLTGNVSVYGYNQ